MKPLAALAAVLVLSGCGIKLNETGAFLDPQFSDLIPSDTTLLLGVNVERLVKTPVYQKYLSGLPLPGIDELAQRVGLDREKNLWQIVFVSNGKSGFVLGRGKFADDIMSPDFLSNRPGRFLYKGETFYGDDDRALLIVNSTTAAVGPTRLLRAIVDGRNSANAPPRALTGMLKQLPHDAQVWGVWSGGSINVTLPGNLSNATRVLSSLDRATMYLDLSANVKGNISADAVSDSAAQDVHGALATLLSLAKSSKTGAMYQGVDITRNGRAIQLTLDSPPEVLGLLLR